jgi:hypothetical protein
MSNSGHHQAVAGAGRLADAPAATACDSTASLRILDDRRPRGRYPPGALASAGPAPVRNRLIFLHELE